MSKEQRTIKQIGDVIYADICDLMSGEPSKKMALIVADLLGIELQESSKIEDQPDPNLNNTTSDNL